MEASCADERLIVPGALVRFSAWTTDGRTGTVVSVKMKPIVTHEFFSSGRKVMMYDPAGLDAIGIAGWMLPGDHAIVLASLDPGELGIEYAWLIASNAVVGWIRTLAGIDIITEPRRINVE